MSTVKERVDRLEEALMRLVYIQQKTEIELQEFKKEMKAFKDEMLEFKNEMKAFKNEMLAFKDEMKAFKDEMKAFKDEMLAFKNEMKAFKDEMLEFKNGVKVFQGEMKTFKDEMLEFKNGVKVFQEEMKVFKDEMLEFKNGVKAFQDEMQSFKDWAKKNIETMNRQWGELANRMGTLVEDIFAPSIDHALSRYFKAEPDTIATRYRVRQNGKSLEIDILVLERKKKRAFIVEVKARPDRTDYVEDFLRRLEQIPRFLPELKDFQLIGIYAALNMQEDTVNFLTRNNLYAMVLRGDILEIVNFDALAHRA